MAVPTLKFELIYLLSKENRLEYNSLIYASDECCIVLDRNVKICLVVFLVSIK